MKNAIRNFFISALVLHSSVSISASADPETAVLQWQDGHAGVFLLMFDDATQDQLNLVIPNLKSRGMTATFYVNPGKWQYQPTPWVSDEILGNDLVVFGNHSWNHQQLSAPTYSAAAAEQIKPTQDFFKQKIEGKWPRLISFARPGFTPDPNTNHWLALLHDSQEFSRLMNDFNLVDRPPFGGAKAAGSEPSAKWGYITEANRALALADSAITNKNMEYIIFHGIETPGVSLRPLFGFTYDYNEFIKFLNGLKSRADSKKVWITDHISYIKYKTQRDTATVQSNINGNQIAVNLSYSADANLYDLPLTLRTKLPDGWKTVKVTQSGATVNSFVKDGFVQYNAKLGFISINRIGYNTDLKNGGVTIFEHVWFGGKSTQLAEGSYNIKNGLIRDNDISSVKVSPGYKFVGYDLPYFRGQKCEFFNDEKDFSKRDCNNRISSYKVIKIGAPAR